ncbi:uncharacterized protein LOC141903331 [Tubulanus polymorphus]|uniref:uncharacterized protein LOC141903331 n=1 Tax=Tubulanus polymorphus TaxID=672921 RepID=UPI003DA6A5D3
MRTFCLFSLLLAVSFAVTEAWRSEYLDERDTVHMYWAVKNNLIIFRVSVPTNGWFGFGISPDGNMPGSDVVVGWMDINTTKARLVDAHLTGRSQPTEDPMSDWKLLNASSTNGRMNFTFERYLDTGDDARDMTIKPGMVHIIWAYSNSKIPSLRNTTYHGYDTRGSRELELYKATQVDNSTTDQTTTRHAVNTTAYTTTTMPGPFLPAPHHFSRRSYLDPAKKYLLEWQYDGPPSTVITFRVTVKTTGYVGFGLSKNGGMRDADIVVGWVNHGSAFIRDMHGVGNTMPVPDAYANWTLKEGYEKDGYTQLTFYRQLDTCDKNGDLKIESGAQRIIYAYSDEDPTGPDEMKYHKSNRGAHTLYLLDKPEPTFTPGPDFKSFEFRTPLIEIPSARTTYYQSFHKIPVTGKHHVLKIEQIVQPGNELFVHHMVVLECRNKKLNDSVLSVHGENKSPRVRRYLYNCWTFAAVFAVGAEAIIFPRDTGVSIGDTHDSVYYRLEIHYDNPHRKSGIYDTSGVRFTYTSKLRKYDVGLMSAGMDFGEPLSTVIPPRQEQFKYRGFCPQGCLEGAFKEYTGDEKEIKIFSVFGHAHLAGVGIRTRHFRDGLELPWIFDDTSYDFNYQIWRPLREPVIVKPGDTIMTECTFNTEERENVTYAGEATTSEMCYSFISYYPKIPLTYCQTFTDTTGPATKVWWDQFKDKNIDWTNWPKLKKIMLSFYEESDTWTDQEKIRQFQHEILNTQYWPQCGSSMKNQLVPDKPFTFAIKEEYKPLKRNTCGDDGISHATSLQATNFILSFTFLVSVITFLKQFSFYPSEFLCGKYSNDKEKLFFLFPRPLKIRAPISFAVTEAWRSEYLDKRDTVHMYWAVKNNLIIFRVSVPTNGWFGFGISPDGNMPGSDVVVGWMDTNTTKARLVDAHLTGRSKPTEDPMSDWKLLNASSTNGRMNFTFERYLDTGDDAHDMTINPGMVHIIWAYSNSKIPSLRNTTYHGYDTRGSRELELYKATDAVNSTIRSPGPEPEPTPGPTARTTTRHAVNATTAYTTTTMPGTFLPAPHHFSRRSYLDPAKKYLLEWQYDGPPSTVITFRVTVKTTGYVGFGLSKNGGMRDADIVVGWVNHGSAFIRDMHGVGNTMPVPDAYANWTLKEGYEKDGYTQLTFYRQLDTCDKNGDLKIESGAQRIIYAYSDEDPTGPDEMKYHKSNRGAHTLYLLDKPEPTFTPGPDFKSFEFRTPLIEQIVQPGNELHIHHMAVKECRNKKMNDSVLSVHGDNKSPRVRSYSKDCWTFTAVFGIGGEAIIFPRDTGLSIGDTHDSVYYRLVIHYDNPHRKSGIYDTSGVRFTYTSKLRKYDVGLMTAGMFFGERLSTVIPPRQEKFKYRGFCPQGCLEGAFKEYTGDEKEIKIFSVLGHAHLAGVGIRTRHFRDGFELPWISDDTSYDFNYQIWRPLREPVIVKPGDTIMTECTFNTEERENVTYVSTRT